MIPISELQDLARFRTSSGDAISFYFQPGVPTELAHREEPILTKERIQQTFGRLRAGSAAVRRDVERLLATVQRLKGNRNLARVIFACSSQNIWREYDIAGLDTGAHFEAGDSFFLSPLVPALEHSVRCCIALADRNRARLLLLQGGVLTEHSRVLDEEKEKIRTTGTGGSRSLERRVDTAARQHFRFLADHLLHFHEHKDFDLLLIGCRDEMWSEIRDVLHPQLLRILVGHFVVDPGLASRERILARVRPILAERQSRDEASLLETVFGETARHGLGCTGLAAVARAMEQGEVRTLLWSRSGVPQPESASLCPSCDHIQAGRAERCDLCGNPMHFFPDAREALFRRALTLGTEIHVLRDVALPPGQHFAAVLRFRADRNTARGLASQGA